ncbi:MAG: hypothetical protein H0X02_08525, partial [Nitrosomonas sp.]|nr:hypothetical protein [Nitrosomonas sp.]
CGANFIEPPPKGVVLTKPGRYFSSTVLRPEDRTVAVMFPNHTVTVSTAAGVIGEFFGATNFLTQLDFSEGFTADLVAAEPFDANTPLTNASEVAGNVVLVQAGGCFASVKLQNVVDAGGIGMIIVNPAAAAGAASTIAVSEFAPSLSISNADGNTILAQLNANVPAQITVTDLTNAGGQVVYSLGFVRNVISLAERDRDANSDTNAFRNGYITITPGTQDYTYALSQKDVDNLCCRLQGVLTAGPTICSHRSRNTTSEILPLQVQAARQNPKQLLATIEKPIF